MTKYLSRLIRNPGKRIHWIPRPWILISGMYLALLCLGGCQQKQKSPQLQALLERYNQIQNDMTQEQVDTVFAGYLGTKAVQVQRHNPDDGTELPRPSTFQIRYVKRPIDEEGLFVDVFFDDAGYVLGKHIGEVLR